MAPSRRKAVAQEAPQTIEEATALIMRYAAIITGGEQIRADADAAIAAIEGSRDNLLTPLDQEAKGIFLQLRAWWAVAAPELTDGKRKSTEIAGCMLGERMTPLKLKLTKGFTAEAAIAWLMTNEQPELVRVKKELDKPALLKAIKASDMLARSLQGAGFGTEQKEEFFIDRAAPAPADPEIVPVEEIAA